MNALNQFARYWGDKRFRKHPVIAVQSETPPFGGVFLCACGSSRPLLLLLVLLQLGALRRCAFTRLRQLLFAPCDRRLDDWANLARDAVAAESAARCHVVPIGEFLHL